MELLDIERDAFEDCATSQLNEPILPPSNSNVCLYRSYAYIFVINYNYVDISMHILHTHKNIPKLKVFLASRTRLSHNPIIGAKFDTTI